MAIVYVCCYCHEYRERGEMCPACGCECAEAATEEDREANGIGEQNFNNL